jgi:hypothetical protein
VNIRPAGGFSPVGFFSLTVKDFSMSAAFDLATHNGFVSMTSNRTGEHRTFRIWTQKEDSKFMPGRRLVGLLVGSDNENDYQAFGVLSESGDAIYLWKKYQGSQFYEWVSAALVAPERFADRVEFSFDGRCRVCNRLLTDPVSVDSGIGPKCAERVAAAMFGESFAV